MTSPGGSKNMHLNMTGTNGSAVSAIREVKAELGSVHSKTVYLDVITRGHREGVDGLGRVRDAADGAAAAHARHSRETDRASSSLHGHASASDRARGSLHGLSDDADRANQSMGRLGDGSGRVSGGLYDVGGGAGVAAAKLSALRDASEAVAVAHRKAQAAAQDYDTAYAQAYQGSSGKTVRDKEAEADLATAPQRKARDESQSEFRRVSQAAKDLRSSLVDLGSDGASSLAGLGSTAGRLGGMLGTVGMGMGYATAGAGLLTGAVGALGVVSAGSLGLVGAGLGAASVGMASFAVDSLKDMKGWKQEFEGISKTAKGYAANISEPMGAALVGMWHDAEASLPALAAVSRTAMEETGDNMRRQVPGIVGAAAIVAGSIANMSKESGPSFDAFGRNLPALAAAVVDPLEQVNRTFARVADTASREGVPAFAQATHSLGAFGSEIVEIGAENLAPALRGIASLTDGATDMAHKLRPAIGPSMDAFVDLGNAGMGAVGTLSPEIAGFARTVSANAPGIQQGLEGIGRGAFAMADTTVKAVGASGPLLERWGGAVEKITGMAEDAGGAISGGAKAGGGFDNMISGLLKQGGTWGQATNAAMVGLGMLQPNQDPLFQAMNAQGAEGVAPIGSKRGGRPGEFSGLTTSWVDMAPEGMPARLMPAAPGSDKPLTPTQQRQIETAEAQIEAGGRSGELSQNQRRAAEGKSQLVGIPGATPEAPRSLGPAPESAPPSPTSASLPMMPRPSPVPWPSVAAPPPPLPPEPMLEGAAPRVGSSAPMGPAVRRIVQEAQPEAQSAGADLGASITSGMSTGMTTTEERVHTVMRKTTKKVIDVIAEELDAHSPSRKAEALFQSVPQGAALGLGSNSGNPIGAARSMASQVLGAAQAQLGGPGGLGGLGGQLGQQLGPNLFGSGDLSRFLPTDPLSAAAREVQGYAGAWDTASKAQAGAGDGADKHQSALEKLGYSPATQKAVTERQKEHNERAERRREERGVDRAVATGAMSPDDAWAKQQEIAMRYDQPDLYKQLTAPKPAQEPGWKKAMGLAGDVLDLVNPITAVGKQVGAAVGTGVFAGLGESAGNVAKAAGDMAGGAIDGMKKKLGISSPSTVAADVASEVEPGFTRGLGSASDAMVAVASDRALPVGYAWARSVVDEADRMIKKANYRTLPTPQLEDTALATLGWMGFLGPAGGGAQISKTPTVTMPAASAAGVPITVNGQTNVYLGEQQLYAVIDERINVAFGESADSVVQHSG